LDVGGLAGKRAWSRRAIENESAAAAAVAVVVDLEYVEYVAGNFKAEEWGGGGVVREERVVEVVRGGVASGAASLDVPFKAARVGQHKALRLTFRRRDSPALHLQAQRRTRYEGPADLHPAPPFGDRVDSDCLALQGKPNCSISIELLLKIIFGCSN
jgi:hypothetical protein